MFLDTSHTSQGTADTCLPDNLILAARETDLDKL